MTIFDLGWFMTLKQNLHLERGCRKQIPVTGAALINPHSEEHVTFCPTDVYNEVTSESHK